MTARIEVVVSAVRAIARDVVQVDLKARSGVALAGAEAGAHIDLHLPHGPVRQYSLVNAQPESAPMDHWRIAIGWDANSRGGSHWIHEKLRVGQVLQASSPRNQFRLDPAHRRVLLVAGGIGMTPIYAMARHCAAMGIDWQLIACARSATRQVYAEELKALGADRVETWCDADRGAPIDLSARLAHQRWDGVYACGPAPMLNALEQAASHWTAGSVRVERFKAGQPVASERKVFELVLAQSGLATQVSAEESVLDAIERLGMDHPSSCREGLCGTCEAPVLDGQVEHHDSVLSAAEKATNERLMVCVSRCAGARLVLDL
ncbi:PDR/VanB family oxidoreductase [Caenimonas sp. SL110]|uniref:PDR/VanB family oxidoreductase n=1 Tax=Caenimonas sp. SL110 TaxID=1450524 RepID=UPI0006528E0F|nr:PDR/VanB family oxidoreductase [Caenimonas sp. SL110]